MDKIIFLGFILISFLHLYYCYKEKYTSRCITKCLLMPALFLLVYLVSKTNNYLVFLALVFGFLGDVFLILDEKEKFFLLGLGAFLIGHILYIVELFTLVDFKKVLYIIPFTAIILFLVAFKVYTLLKPNLNNLKIPVIFYITTIVVMFSLAFFTFVTHINLRNSVILLGALLFTISDTILSISLFINKFKHHTFFIMITYISAQFFLSMSLIS